MLRQVRQQKTIKNQKLNINNAFVPFMAYKLLETHGDEGI